MSTPLFIRDPVIGNGNAPGDDSLVTLIDGVDVTESTLVEEVLWAAADFSTALGRITLHLLPSGGGFAHCIKAVAPAGTATLEASGRIAVNVTLPVGWGLAASHNVQLGGGGDAEIAFAAVGGVAR